MLILPFKLSSLHYGFSAAKGTAYIEEGFVIFDVTVKTLSLVEEQPEVVKVAPHVIAEMELNRGWWNYRLHIRTSKRKVLEAVPGQHRDGELRLQIARKDRDRALRFIGQVELLQQQAREVGTKQVSGRAD